MPALSEVWSTGGRYDGLATFPSTKSTAAVVAVDVDWGGFEAFLKADHRSNTVKLRMLYAKKHHHILTSPDGPSRIMELQQLTDGQRREAMKSLANLAKFLGRYDEWKELKRKHDLRWTRFSPEAQASVFEQALYSQDKGFMSMIEWVRDVKKTLSAGYGAYVDFLILTGLRPDEACNSINILLKQGFEKYYNKDRGMREHFHFPRTFIRRTKKAYVSIVTDSLLKSVETIRNSQDSIPESYYNLYHRLEHKIEDNSSDGKTMKSFAEKYGKRLPMNNCRKIFGTWLRMNGIESEFINLLQGRVEARI